MAADKRPAASLDAAPGGIEPRHCLDLDKHRSLGIQSWVCGTGLSRLRTTANH
jgi:hypothetical protein